MFWPQLVIVTIIILSTLSTAHGEKQWPQSTVDFFFPLTFPDAEWTDDDFGKLNNPEEQELLSKFRPRI